MCTAFCDRLASVKATYPGCVPCVRASPWHDVGVHSSAKDCQLRTAYGGESNCIIKTKVCDASKWCISQTDFCPVL